MRDDTKCNGSLLYTVYIRKKNVLYELDNKSKINYALLSTTIKSISD